MGSSLRALWDDPRPTHPPIRVWRDWALLTLVVAGSGVEAALREDRTSLSIVLAVSGVVALSLLWRRTHPLATVVAAFGTLIAFDLIRITALEAVPLMSIAATLLLPYALFRWGSGREAAIGLSFVFVWLAVTHVAEPASLDEVVAGYGFFLSSAALGASLRFHATSRSRDIEQARLRQRNDLARELHDSVGHHVSAIAIQAQAGRAVAATDPDRALEVLTTIEEAAARTLEEMRAMVGILRDDAEAELVPQPGLADLERLAGQAARAGDPRVDVQMSGELDDLAPSLVGALHRIAQEAVTNAKRHAGGATSVTVEVQGGPEQVRLVVSDDGTSGTSGGGSAPGYGLLGMTERVSLLGGTLEAGPRPDGGWTVEAVLPHRGRRAARARAADGSATP